MRLLYSHCIYIDSFTRLDAFEEALLRLGLRTLESSTLESEFPERDFHIPLLKYITSLYIGPFSADEKYLDNIHQIESICNILDLLAHKVKRLVVSIRRQNPYAAFIEDKEFDPLRETFARLTSLEVFCSEDNDFWMRGIEGNQLANLGVFAALSVWPKLRVLALGRTDPLFEHVWKWLGKIEGLETLVLRQRLNNTQYHLNLRHLRRAQNGEIVARRLELFLVNEVRNRTVEGRAVLGKGVCADSECLKIVKVDLSHDDRPDKNDTYKERVIRPILGGHETF